MSAGRITKKVKQGEVKIDFEDSALLVNYELETVRVDENDRPIEVVDNKSEMRRIKIKSLSADKNMAQLAADIVDKCKYIHPSRTEEIEQLLLKLRKHALSNPNRSSGVSPPPRSDEPVIPQYDKISGNGARSQIQQEPSGVRRSVTTENLSGMYNISSGNNAPPPRNTNAFGLNNAGSNNVNASQARDRGERDDNRDRDRERERDRGDRDRGGDRNGGYNDRGGDRNGGYNGGGGGNDRGGDRSGGYYGGSNGVDRGDRDRGDRERDRDRESQQQQQQQRPPQRSALDLLPPAYMNNLDDYLEMLYQVSGKNDREREEGLAMQEKGTSMILKLCLDVVNLEQLIQNGTVMGALTRVLEEEFKKSVDLTFNILRIFLAFSNFVEMHSIMSQYRIGVLTIKAIEYEIKRTEVREQEKLERDHTYTMELNNIKENQHQMSSQEYSTAMEKLRRGKERDAQKSRMQTRKQDKLLFVAFYILLNLAEDLSIERKMIKKSLIPMLSRMLFKGYADLLVLVVTFLKKLSTIEENKEAMKESNVLEVLTRYIPCDSPPLVTITLRYLFNLSFDRELREQMIRYGFVPKLIGLLKTSTYRGRTLKLLYHLSVDDYCKSLFNNEGAMDQIKGLIINFPGDNLAKELAALAINLTYNAKNVELLVANKGLNLLMDRLHDKRQDLLLIKIIRNISLWTFNSQTENENGEIVYNHRGLWSPHIKLLLELARDDNQDIQLEAFGILANMTTFDLPSTSSWSKLLKDFGLLAIFARLLVPGMTQNDMLLELIMLISTIASDAQACSVFASSTMIGLLHQVWKDKSEDVEILLQLLHCFYKFFCHKEAREEAMYSTRVVVNVIDCLAHRNLQVRMMAEKITGIVLEQDRKANGEPGDLGKEIIKKRFESYNKIWLANNMFVSADTMGTITRNDRSRGNSYDYNTAGGYMMGGGHEHLYEPEQISGNDYRMHFNNARGEEEDHDDSGSYNNFNYK